MTITTKNINAPSTVVWAVVPFNATINQFINALNTFNAFAPYQISGVLTMYNANGKATINSSAAYIYNWRVSIYFLRSTADVNSIVVAKYINYTTATPTATATTTTFTQSTFQTHGPLISGNFLLSIGGVALSTSGNNYVPYNIDAASLQASFNSIPGLQNVEVTLLSDPNLNQY